MSRWVVDGWIALAAAMAAFAALALSVWESNPERKYQGLGLPPKVVISYVFNDSGAGFVMANIGAGPAVVHWTTVKIDGKVMPTWINMGAALGIQAPPTFSSIVPSRMWKAGSQQQIFWAEGGAFDKELRAHHARVEIETCYCTVFEECWMTTRAKPDPRPRGSCLPKPDGSLRSSPRDAVS